ncbi:MAG: 3-phosphoglycerate dehydrogenase, partial [Candidatus Electrothrix sp. AR4]|nr:3-phosphoglycerate dehydrogenase [Candidatus Electrothrix sp. AR4]
MQSYPINILNAIADEGLDLFDAHYDLKAEQEEAQGLLVRSSPVDLTAFPNLVAVARAGAGVNNIPVDEASEKG